MYSAEYLRSRDPERHPGSFFSALNELVDFLCDETAAGREMYAHTSSFSHHHISGLFMDTHCHVAGL